VHGEEHQPNVAAEQSFSDGEQSVVNKHGEEPNLVNNVAVLIKDVKRSPTTIDVLSSERRDAGGLLQLVEMSIFKLREENGELSMLQVLSDIFQI